MYKDLQVTSKTHTRTVLKKKKERLQDVQTTKTHWLFTKQKHIITMHLDFINLGMFY